MINDPAALPAPPGSPPPSPPPSPSGSDSEGEDQREAAAGSDGPARKPAPKKCARKHAADAAAAGPSVGSTSGGSTSANSGSGASGSKKARVGPTTELRTVVCDSRMHGLGRMRGLDVSSDDESPSDGRVAAGSSTAPTGANDGLTEAGGEPDEDSTVSGADFRAEVERLEAENETLKAESSAAATAATAEIERLKTEIKALKAEKCARQSVEVTLPDDRTWTFAEQYVLQPGPESLVGLVGEKLEAMPDAPLVRVAPPGHSLILHHPDRGYVSDREWVGSLLQQLVTSVRGAVSAVDVDEEDQEKLDSTMCLNLKKVRTLAGNIKESMVEAALISHPRFNPANVLTLDTQSGILNLVGGQIATYDRATCTVALVDRDPDSHLVSRTTGVDCAWLEPELGQLQQAEYSGFQSTRLNRWIVDSEARQYMLCAAGSALFGGDTTRIKSSLLVIGGPDQGKTALLNAIVAAGGWQLAGGSMVNTSEYYSFSGADPKSLQGKASVGTARSGVLGIGNGLRLIAFNELESGDVWSGVKTLANAERQPITKKNQSSGAVSMQSVSTPYALLSCNLEKRPPPPQTDVKTKVAVITPTMLGTFVDDKADGQKTFKKQVINSSNDSVGLASRIAVLRLATLGASPVVLTSRSALARGRL